MNILANDGMAHEGVKKLEALGHKVSTTKIAQEELTGHINDYDVLIVRSATKVPKTLIDQMTRTSLIIRAGVGLDNIDVDAAESKGIKVSNTPSASSRSVAELAFGHCLAMARYIGLSNRIMPLEGSTQFKSLKKQYSNGVELKGKTMGIIGFGRIGQELAKLALGAGMRILAHDPWSRVNEIEVCILDQKMLIDIPMVSKEELLSKSDFISVHTPKLDQPMMGEAEMGLLKPGTYLVNTSRGGIINEEVLLKYLDNGKIGGCALDVFVGEPTPNQALLSHPLVSVTPHIGASTKEAQLNIADVIVELITDHQR